MAQRRGAGVYTNYSKNYRPTGKSKGAADARFLTALGGSGRLSEGGASGLIGAAARAITRAAAKSATKSAAKTSVKASAKTAGKEAGKATKPTAAFSKGGINAKYNRTASGSTVPNSKRGIEMMTPARGTPAQKGQATKMMKAWRAENAAKSAAKSNAKSASKSKSADKPQKMSIYGKPSVTKTDFKGMKPSKKTVGAAAASVGGVTGAALIASQKRRSQRAANRADVAARIKAKGSKR